MCEIHFPKLDEFSNKLCSAIKNSGNERSFVTKWGLKSLSDVYDILNNNIQGGYDSHKHLILSTAPSDSVLTIGPGMGFCVFLLSELYDSVFVAEPDEENCDLIQSISTHYITDKNKSAGDIVNIFNAGLSITDEAIKYWDIKRNQMKKRNVNGSILNFVIKGASELKDIFHNKVSRIYLHKVLSSLSISNSFENIVSEVVFFLKEDGVITWAEPDYIFNDIILVDGQGTITNTLKPLFNNKGINFNMMSYKVQSRFSGNSVVENWDILKAGRLLNEGS
ncbi:hypothetical protein THIOM_000010 [Candidatus Thiomargarita nelsonii]|uniref:Uncharacterized protein n=1 Tax=Candidatus Thiomargarita nelsonii TaxID=1003181 RepID=A0A0A6P1A5_9GAMM|nr:hypothetical protein THIOM_000010 [Candidatus Thiomargarita nelsonii]